MGLSTKNLLRKNYTNSINMNEQYTRFLNLWALNESRRVEMPLTSINQSKKHLMDSLL